MEKSWYNIILKNITNIRDLNNSALNEWTLQKALYENARPTISSITFDDFVNDNYFNCLIYFLYFSKINIKNKKS